jgi:hypothetical protein
MKYKAGRGDCGYRHELMEWFCYYYFYNIKDPAVRYTEKEPSRSEVVSYIGLWGRNGKYDV